MRAYLPGWKNYFALAETPGVFQALDEWIRHRLRQLHLEQWKTGKTIYRELPARGVPDMSARRIAGNNRRWWQNSCKNLNGALPNGYFDALGLPSLRGSPISPNRRMRTRMYGGVPGDGGGLPHTLWRFRHFRLTGPGDFRRHGATERVGPTRSGRQDRGQDVPCGFSMNR